MKLLLISDAGELIQSFDDIEKHDTTSAQGVLALLDLVERMAEAAKGNHVVSRPERSVARALTRNGTEG